MTIDRKPPVGQGVVAPRAPRRFSMIRHGIVFFRSAGPAIRTDPPL